MSSSVSHGALRIRIEGGLRVLMKNQISANFEFFNRIDPKQPVANGSYRKAS